MSVARQRMADVFRRYRLLLVRRLVALDLGAADRPFTDDEA